MNKHKGRLLLAGLAIAAFVWATSGASEAASRTVTLTVEKVQKMIVDTINSMVPGMIEDAIDARVEELSQAPAGGEEVYPVTNPIILNPIAGDINVRDYGAKGDGVTDDTAAINAAITAANAKGGGTVYVPDGIYKIPMKTYTNVNVLSNVKLQLADNAVIKGHYDAAAYDSNHAVVRVRDQRNVEITGGTIQGFKQERDVANEYGHGLAIQGSTNVYVHDIRCTWNDGDGILIGYSTAQRYCQDVLIERFLCDYNNRQGITIYSARNLTIRDGQTNYQYGSYPMSGIDLEPQISDAYIDKVLIDNVIATGNGENYPHRSYCYGIEIGFGWWYSNGGNTNGTPISLKISNCRLYGNGNSDGYQINTNNIPTYLNSPIMNIDYITLENNTYTSDAGESEPPPEETPTTVTLANLMSNPSFDSSFTGWTSGTITSRTIDSGGDGARAAIVASAQSGRLYQVVTGLTTGHQYYFRATLFAPNTNLGYCGIQGKTYLWLAAANTPEVLSSIYAATATSHTVQFADYRASGWDAIYGDNFMLVDLTAAYGAGNEPAKATCDAWSYFTGTYEVEV